MSTFVLIEPDSFAQGFATVAKQQRVRDVDDPMVAVFGRFAHVRRPVRGIQIKDDTYATLQVRDAQGVPLELFDAAADGDTGKGRYNSNFLLQQIVEQRVEKQQIILTFGEPYIFFFGEHPRMLNITGVLLNTEDFNWRAEWWENYENYLRGTACVRARTRVYLSWDDIVVEGYVTKAAAQETAPDKNFVQFQFEMFLTNYQNVSNIGPAGVRISNIVNLDPSVVKLPGASDASTTVLVRQKNVQEAALAQGQGAQSLLESLRNGRTQDLQNWMTEIDGQIVDTLAMAGQFISGRNLRVPVGYQGSAAFDQGVQIALASIPGALDIVQNPKDPTSARTVTLSAVGSKLVQGFTATLDALTIPYEKGAGPGLPLSANKDEFIARSVPGASPMVAQGLDLFSDQRQSQEDAGNKVADVFRAYGVEVDSSSDLNNLFKKTMFGIASVGLGMNLSNAPGFTQALNQIGTIL